jgi:cell division protein FtsW (lipid II flippase)
MAKIAVGGNIAGVIFAVASMAIFLIGLPMLWFLFPAAIVLGCAVAVILHFMRHETRAASKALWRDL